MGLSENQIPLIEAIVSLAKQLEKNLKGMGLTANIDDYEYYSGEIEECVDTIQTITNIVLNKKAEPVRQTVKQVQQVTAEVKAEEQKAKKERRAYSRFDADQKADIIRRYKNGEGPKAISESLGCSRSLITHIIHDAGAVEGRTGAHLNKGTKKEPAQEPAADMSPDAASDVVETEDERDKRLKKERIEWQKAHPNKW